MKQIKNPKTNECIQLQEWLLLFVFLFWWVDKGTSKVSMCFLSIKQKKVSMCSSPYVSCQKIKFLKFQKHLASRT